MSTKNDKKIKDVFNLFMIEDTILTTDMELPYVQKYTGLFLLD